MPQHVIQRGNNRTACFFAPRDYRLCLDCLAEAATRYACLVHAYVLMTNHVHLLVTPQQPQAMSRMMQHIGRCFVRGVNAQYKRTGTLWEGRFKSSPVDPQDYIWSSHRHYAEGRFDPLLTESATFQGLGATPLEQRLAFRELFRDQLDDEELHRIRTAVNQCRPLGSKRFKEEIVLTLGGAEQPAQNKGTSERATPHEGDALFPFESAAAGSNLL